MSDKEKNANEERMKQFYRERELLYKQFELLAEQSKNCSPTELAELSDRMIAIHDFLF